jgi:hypothetical protein
VSFDQFPRFPVPDVLQMVRRLVRDGLVDEMQEIRLRELIRRIEAFERESAEDAERLRELP